MTVLTILLSTLTYLLLGQGVWALYRRAKKTTEGQIMCLGAWPLMLGLFVFIDSTLEW